MDPAAERFGRGCYQQVRSAAEDHGESGPGPEPRGTVPDGVCCGKQRHPADPDYLQERAEIGDQLAITQPRHLEAVRRAVEHLEDALRTLEQWTPDLAATDLQAAQNALSEVTGDQADEKLLDKVFSEFCVGK